MIGAVGDDPLAEEAVAGLVEAGVELDVERKGQTGVALIYVDAEGENEIAVFPGANAEVTPREVEGVVLCQLEVSDEVVYAAAEKASFFALNAAPARELDLEPDLLVVNKFEHEVMKRGKLVAVTYGADGAVLYENGKQVAGSASPMIIARDGTGAGDAFTACLLVGLLEERPYEEALRRACIAGRVHRSEGRCPERGSRRHRRRELAGEERLMATPILIDCDPGHDDAVALMLAVASPEVELVGVTTVVGNQTVEKTTVNALRVLELCGRSDVPVAKGAAHPLVRQRSVAAHVHGETGLDGPDLPPPSREPVAEHAVSFLARQIREHDGKLTVIPVGPLTNIALLLALEPDARPERIVLMGGSVGEGNRTPAAEFNIWADPEAARRVFESGIDITMIGLDVTHQALVTDADAEAMRGLGKVGKVAAELFDFYGRWHKATYPDLDGSPLHDPVAVAHVIDPTLVETKPAYIEIDCSWEQGRGRTNVDWRGRLESSPPNATVGLGIDNERS